MKTTSNRKAYDLLTDLEQKLKAAGYSDLTKMLPELSLSQVKLLLDRTDSTDSAAYRKIYEQRAEEETVALAKLSHLQKQVLIKVWKQLTEGRFKIYAFKLSWLIHSGNPNAQAASCSRTLKRLEQRGLLTRHPPEKTEYVRLTDLGIRVVKRLMIQLSVTF